jgi:hypothetical protein
LSEPGDNVQKIIKLYNDLADTEINDKSIPIVQEKCMRTGNEIKIDVRIPYMNMYSKPQMIRVRAKVKSKN